MREFRAWDRKKSRWADRNHLRANGFGHVWEQQPWTSINTFDEHVNGQPRYQACFYTGRKDKNGVEIYEGDIVRKTNPQTGHKTGLSTIAYHVHSARFAGLSFSKDMEVIGNIYEHSHLLESKPA